MSTLGYLDPQGHPSILKGLQSTHGLLSKVWSGDQGIVGSGHGD